ncbi:MAG: sigma-54-dependent Fis family transcriptional regulator [Bacillota bacterium]|nr:sigma-54-dependent Fis family transcriptional regulator [Bacillota bacterium]
MENLKILLVCKDKNYINIIKTVLLSVTKNISVCDNIADSIEEMSNNNYKFYIAENKLFNKDFTIKHFVNAYQDTDLIVVASEPSYSDGSKSISNGAREYINLKDDICILPNKILDIYNEKNEQSKLKEKLLNNYLLDSNNDEYKKMLHQCEKVAKSKANVLLIGETGSGKEVAAKYIHLCSPRCTSSFLAVNCSAYTETLLESELFGHEQGSFTGAVKSKQGKFELANNGSLFLDEVGDINLTTQVKLLRVLETKRVERLGSNKEKLIDYRLISATNKDLTKEVIDNNFREDFFYRISSIVIHIPPLRKRKEDIELLVNYFLQISQEENEIKINHIEPDVMNFLYTYDYPGNIRELKSIIDRMVVLSNNGIITKNEFPVLFNIHKDSKEVKIKEEKTFNKIIPFKDYVKNSEAEYLTWVLNETNGNVAEAARQLNISARQVFNKINEYDIKKKS